ncbi:DUF3324 domain-containing protein [Companilactobacillus keshanensis]|uniref:WxL protein host-binding domain-containing protein n=1 Tax=Companilactobacillus keshanensis TaxID=2486003 RepID=A0ABW4BTH4_9LACO|nr:DUF3324 domain-containing protein [Companilactobacillus keshanensis]
MKRVSKRTLFVFFAIFGLILSGLATIQTAQAASGDYAIKPEASVDEVNTDNGTYVVEGDPGQQVQVKIGVINKANKTRRFVINANTAYTTNGGQPGYDRSKVSDPKLKIQTRDAITPNHIIATVNPGKEMIIPVTLTIPKKKFSGYIMGGFNVKPYKEKAKGTVSANGTLIKNKFSYSLPIQIHQKSSGNQDPKYSINTVKPALVTGNNAQRAGVNANVRNSSNGFVASMNSKATVTKKGDKSFKVTNSQSGQSIAPTSNYNYSISWGKKPMKAGNYHLKLVYKTNDGIKSWTLNKDFTITNAQAAKYNKLAGIKPNYMWLYILLGILLLAIILGLGIYLGKKNNNGGNGNTPNKPNKSTRKRRR